MVTLVILMVTDFMFSSSKTVRLYVPQHNKAGEKPFHVKAYSIDTQII